MVQRDRSVVPIVVVYGGTVPCSISGSVLALRPRFLSVSVKFFKGFAGILNFFVILD